MRKSLPVASKADKVKEVPEYFDVEDEEEADEEGVDDVQVGFKTTQSQLFTLSIFNILIMVCLRCLRIHLQAWRSQLSSPRRVGRRTAPRTSVMSVVRVSRLNRLIISINKEICTEIFSLDGGAQRKRTRADEDVFDESRYC